MIRSLFILVTFLSINVYSQAEFVPGEILVKVKNNSGAAFGALENFVDEVDSRFTLVPNMLLVRTNQRSDIFNMIEELRKDPNVIYAEPNYIYTTVNKTRFPNDRNLKNQWGINNDGTFKLSIEDSDIDAPEAWNIFTGSRQTVVAVIDTGVDYTHEDLKDNMWVNENEIPGDGIDNDNNGYIDDIHGWNFAYNNSDPMDDDSHGTHCAGVIGASGNNGIGIAGVNWSVKLMALKFLDGDGGGSASDAIKAIEYAVLNGADILSNSWGGRIESQALKDVVQAASDKGVLFVAAAGNSYSDNDIKPTIPASFDIPGVISVAATDQVDAKPPFSCFGKKTVHIGAPGDFILSTVPENKYEKMSGTSMAAPFVSGAAALLLSYDPSLTAKDLKERLMKTSDKSPRFKDLWISGGRLNLFNALTNHEPPSPWPVVDEDRWRSVEKQISTPHPYPLSYSKRWEIKHEGASHIRVHFSKVEVESFYDNIQIFNEGEQLFEEISGKKENFWSVAVPGDTVIIKHSSDKERSLYGFDIDSYDYTERLPSETLPEWTRHKKEISSKHPYKPSTTETWKIRHKGAKAITLHFSKVDMEDGYDVLYIRDKDGNTRDVVTGGLTDYYTREVKGDTVYIDFISDSVVNKYGFDLDSYKVKE